MDKTQLARILEELEPEMALSVPLEWVELNVEGVDAAYRDLDTVNLAGGFNWTWERDPTANKLTFSKQPAAGE